jgi:hypothetical protein
LYPAGWAGIADSYLVMEVHRGLPPNEAMPKSKTAAVKALDLDSSLAEAHASLAAIKLHRDWTIPVQKASSSGPSNWIRIMLPLTTGTRIIL